MRKRWWLAIGTVAVAAAATAVALSLSLGGGGGRPEHFNHHDYARIWQETHVGESRDVVLARWPSDPSEHYTDNLKDDCFEWSDERRYIYNLCFSQGILRTKDLV